MATINVSDDEFDRIIAGLYLLEDADDDQGYQQEVTETRQLRERLQTLKLDRKRTADRVDGYDRDDLGDSPDY
jgi:hypothetical protein